MILDEIVEHKRIEVETRRREAEGSLAPSDGEPARDFAGAIRRVPGSLPRIIAEVKKASPSKGLLREDFNPAFIAAAYERAGAAAISVLTDERFFEGHLSHLAHCRDAVSLPLLRKDFIIDRFQIHEARSAGADAILLIAALLDTSTLRAFREEAAGLGMACLVEVHNEQELESALASGAPIIGINNRDLRTFEVDIGTTLRLAPRIPEGRIIVSESAIRTRDDLRRLADAGVDAALIGEALMRAPDPGESLKELIG